METTIILRHDRSDIPVISLLRRLTPSFRLNNLSNLLTACAGGAVSLFQQDVVIGGARATGSITNSTGVPANNNTVVIGGRTYTFKTAITASADDVLIGASITASMQNLIDAVNGTGTSGVQYSAATTKNPMVSAKAGTVGVVELESRFPGIIGNLITLAVTGANLARSGATMTGGADGEAV